MKRIITTALSAALAIVGLTALPAQAANLLPRGCEGYGHEASVEDFTSIRCTGVTGASDFTQYPNLTYLDLNYLGGGVTTNITRVPAMPASLEELRIGHVTAAGWENLYALPNLARIAIYDTAAVPDLARLAASAPGLESFIAGVTTPVGKNPVNLTAARAMHNLETFRLYYEQTGVAATGMVNTPIRHTPINDITGKPLAFTSTDHWGKSGSAGLTYTMEGDHQVTYDGDLYDAREYLDHLDEWSVTQESTVRVQDMADLHYVPEADRERITGTTRVGSRLALDGRTLPLGYEKYQWLRDGEPIPGATKSTYVQTAADIGKRISVQYTDTDGRFVDDRGSREGVTRYYVPVTATASARSVTLGLMSQAKSPAITGTRKVNSVLTARPSFGLSGTTVKYQWLRNGKKITGATKARYRLQTRDYGKKISVKATASKKNYVTVTKKSGAVRPAARPLKATSAPKITGTLKAGSRLNASTGSWAAKPSKVRYQWYLDGIAWYPGTGSTFKVPDSYDRQKIKVRAYAVRDGYTEGRVMSAAVSVKPNLKREPVRKPKRTCTFVAIRDLSGNEIGVWSCKVS
ncbi:hypothetical protein [Arthrobacter mobilis]|uniref:Leucine rich repeat-containing protein n=1 Tax=Arthrobacter mobilis TaxID=2724944 RepID=A0A7X6HF06_9MICC|nr:hypothetical protein [Arthrobacter mobilis]NKX55962.1 hypothetical protein [Arthrobacter mobilis]